MSNMSYRRFQNTIEALRDCQDHLVGELDSPEETRARERLIKLCVEIARDVGDIDE